MFSGLLLRGWCRSAVVQFRHILSQQFKFARECECMYCWFLLQLGIILPGGVRVWSDTVCKWCALLAGQLLPRRIDDRRAVSCWLVLHHARHAQRVSGRNHVIVRCNFVYAVFRKHVCIHQLVDLVWRVRKWDVFWKRVRCVHCGEQRVRCEWIFQVSVPILALLCARILMQLFAPWFLLLLQTRVHYSIIGCRLLLARPGSRA